MLTVSTAAGDRKFHMFV